MESIKFYSQTLALLLLFLITGLFFWKYYRSNSFLSVAAGIFLHEIADTWAFPDWNFPLFEPYLIAVYKGYFQNIILREITSVTEWIFFTSIIGITFYMITKEYSKDSEMEINRTNELFSGILGSIFIIFILFVSIAFFLFVTAF